ncbi:MAG TPA: TIM-barrel domain-containing protein, partial [Verrucomicrobiae bacterium]
MKRFVILLVMFAAAAPLLAQSLVPEQILPGVWRFRIGQPEAVTPTSARHYPPLTNALALLPAVDCPIAATGSISSRGCLVSLPLAPDELVYGLGLQFKSFQQRGLKKMLRVNADPVADSGDSHAPVPFYVTTRGYGVFVDTARYATFYCGDTRPKSETAAPETSSSPDRQHTGEPGEMKIEIPRTTGVDVYVFAGPSLRAAVQRYNLYSGGGPLAPRWGLGFWYRCDMDFDQAEVLKMAATLRDEKMPCDVLGLEPGWQSHAYSCSFVWSKKFPDPAAMVTKLAAQNYHLNLWQHAFTHPSSPIYQPLLAHSGDYQVWGGLVPDFLDADARRIFGKFNAKEHVALGVSGYKLDECDNSDFTG